MVKRCLLVLFLFSVTVYADVQVHDGLISVDLQSQPLTQVLDRLKSQTDLHLFIDEGLAGKTISASFQNLPVAVALKKMLEGTGINYVVLAGPKGEPESVFVGGSSRPGSAPRPLDNRPVNGRSVVTPVNPPGPIPQPARDTRPNRQNREYNPGVNVPTGGGFVPQTPQPEQEQDQEQQQEENPDDNSESN